ncbi:MAG TPA: hypothetical protein VFU21_03260 [Kofleriaceae bacterium]|nr:hypothetical protein [Kofleriaceae bacterium]
MRRIAPLLLVSLWATAAAAQPRSDGRHLLDEGAALVVRGEAEELERMAQLARSLGGELSQVVNLASIGSAGALGFDLLSRAGWPVVGLDPARPFFVQVSPSSGGLRHARAVAAIGDPADLTAWSRRIPALDRAWIAEGNKGDLGSMLGIKGEPAEVSRALVKRKVEVVGWSSVLKVYAFVRRDGGFLVVDLLVPRGRALDWSRDGQAVLARLEPPRKGLPGRRGVASATGKPGVVLWTRPGAVFDLLADPPERACADLAPAARDSGLTDLAVSLRRSRTHLEIHVTYGITDGSHLVPALAMVDDRLATTRLGDAVLAATLYTGSLATLRGLPRAAAIRAGWVPLWRRVRECGRAIRAELEVFAWPELFAQWLDEVDDLSPDAAALVASVRNLGVAAKAVSLKDVRTSLGFAEVSLVDRGKPAAEGLLDSLFGARRTGRRPQRHTTWGKSALRPYLLGPRGLATVGVALGERSLTWRLRRGRGGRDNLLGSVAADGGALLRQIAPDLPPRLAPIGKAAAGRVGSVSGQLVLSRAALALSLSIKIR